MMSSKDPENLDKDVLPSDEFALLPCGSRTDTVCWAKEGKERSVHVGRPDINADR